MRNVIGIDLGGTKITGAVINAHGGYLQSMTIATEAQQGQAKVIQRICNLIKTLAQQVEVDIAAVGVGTPGYVDIKQGIVVYSKGNITDWCDVPLKAALESQLPYPIIIENDANMAAIGESWIGAARELNSFIMLTLGTGVGGAIYRRQSGLWHGHQWCGGEIGHMILYPDGLPCACGQYGCVEQYVSGTAISKHYCALTGQFMVSEEIFTAAERGDLKALQVINKFAHDLSILLTNLKSMLDPQAFIISGGLINARQLWWQLLIDQLKKTSSHGDQIRILPAEHLNQAGCLGAARLALDYVESREKYANHH